MNPRFDFRSEARVEFLDAYRRYEDQRAGLGEEFAAEVSRVLRRVEAFPESFRADRQGVRRAILKRFPDSIYYLIETPRLIVLALYHAKRDPEGWRSRLTD